MELKNLMEDVVMETVGEVLNQQEDICNCEKCRMDIACHALNHLSPKYVVSYKGEVFTKVNLLMQQFRIDVLSAVTQAMILVGRNPRH